MFKLSKRKDSTPTSKKARHHYWCNSMVHHSYCKRQVESLITGKFISFYNFYGHFTQEVINCVLKCDMIDVFNYVIEIHLQWFMQNACFLACCQTLVDWCYN
jgi:hypothetical protein